MMRGLSFIVQAPVVESDPNRTDVACFVGFINRRSDKQGNFSLPSNLERWLVERGWNRTEMGRGPLETLLDVPVPIDNWTVFDLLFEWESRPFLADTGDKRRASTYLGAAVRSFFAQGGRKCYVVRAGDVWPLLETKEARADARNDRLAKLIPGYPAGLSADPVDQASWRGIGHLYGLQDISFLSLPDLADVVGDQPPPIPEEEPVSEIPEQFVVCTPGEEIPEPQPAKVVSAPVCDEDAYRVWATALRMVAEMLYRNQREVQLIGALPIPESGTAAEKMLLEALIDDFRGPLANHPRSLLYGLASTFVQLAYPWVRTAGSGNLPQQLESPDGVLAGILARNALTRGAFRSAAGQPVGDAYDVHPALPREQMLATFAAKSGAEPLALWQRVSLFGPTPSGLQLLSDVTTSLDENYRQAHINRLVSLVVRAARRIGRDAVFEASGEQLWASLRQSMERLMQQLLQLGALRGESAAEAFTVRCDRTTMTQNDLDNGRLIAELQFNAAAAIEKITVVLALDEGGQVSLVGTTPNGG